MSKYQFVKCLNPQRIRNPYTKEQMVVSCGKCEACLLNKSDLLTMKCNLECKSHDYCMFVTLTYSWDNIPLCNVTFNDNGVASAIDDTPRLKKYKNLYRRHLGDFDSKESDIQLLRTKVNYDKFPYLLKEDLQLFIKRFRKNLSKHTDEKIRYFGCGEYGPIHFRPHFHLLLWFSESETLWVFEKVLRKSWKFGRVDFSLSRGSCAQYTASYVNSRCNLPKIYKLSKTRPFAIHSSFLGEGVLQRSLSEIYQRLEAIEYQSVQPFKTSNSDRIRCGYESIVKRCVEINGTNTDTVLWRSLKVKYFPRCRSFSNIGFTERLFAYRTYETARNWTKEISPYRQAKRIIEYVYEHFHNGHLSNRVEHFCPEYDKLLEYLFEQQRFSTRKMCRCDKDMFEQMFHSLVLDLYVSRSFIRVRDELKIDSYQLVHLIEKFYAIEDLCNLQNSLADQEILTQEFEYIDEDINKHCEDYFYNNVNYDLSTFTKSVPYNAFKSRVISRYEDKIKHKKLNDECKRFHDI